MPLSPFRQKWLQMFPGFHKSPHPPPLPPSHQGRCSVTWIPQNLQERLHKYSSGLEPKRTLLIICLTCISYQSWYFSSASFPTLTWMSFKFVNVVKKLVVVYQSEVQWLWRTIAFLTTMLFPTLYEMVWMFTASLLGMLSVAKFAIPR